MTSSRIERPASRRPEICALPDQSRVAMADRPSGQFGGRFLFAAHHQLIRETAQSLIA